MKRNSLVGAVNYVLVYFGIIVVRSDMVSMRRLCSEKAESACVPIKVSNYIFFRNFV